MSRYRGFRIGGLSPAGALIRVRGFVCHSLSDDLSGCTMTDLPLPIAGIGEVLVSVKATSVNFPDILMCQGKYQYKPDLPFVPGIDVAGVIVGLGDEVTDWSIGDEIVGSARFGGFAEYAILGAGNVQRKPHNLNCEQAAAYPTAYLTAYVALICRANLQAGETLVVHGASGGVGLAACDLGRHLGAQVIATSASDAKLTVLNQLGFHKTINVTNGFKDNVKDLTNGRGADVIFDPVGGDVFDESLRCIAFNGRLLTIGFTSGRIPTLPVNLALIKGISLMGVRAGEYGRQFPMRGRDNIESIHKLISSGALNPHVGATFGLEETRLAFTALTSRQIIGKAVIVIS